MEKPKKGQFKRRFSDTVGKLPFPGRHTVGPATIHALRTPNIEIKQRERRIVSRFRLANMMVGLSGVATGAQDIIMMAEGHQPVPEAYGVPLVLGSVVTASSFASAYAQSYLIERIDHSIETAKQAPYEVGIDALPDYEYTYRAARWPSSVETRDDIIHGVVFFGWLASNMGAAVINALSQ